MKTIEFFEPEQFKKEQSPEFQKEKHQEPWQQALSRAITDPKQLLQALQLDSSLLNKDSLEASEIFRTFVTRSFLNRMEKGNPDDPLLKQVLADPNELKEHEAFSQDPLHENNANPVPGLLHKYHGRVLLITNSHCAINCRFCFRRSFSYSNNHLSNKNSQAILNYIREDSTIEEVILSGGDPLLLTDSRLEEILGLLESVKHIKRVRIHSRIPIVLPERITQTLVQVLQKSPLQIIMVIHSNHPREFNHEVSEALHLLQTNNIKLLNQSVLLKGVNNDPETLISLQKLLFEHNIQSYYLHLLDKVSGTAHFDLPLDEAKRIYQTIQSRLPGYMVPKLVMEQAGETQKTQIS